MLRLAFFGFPCTTFSISKGAGRETNPYSGPGWALFMNCVKAIERYRPDYFMGENNKSMDNKIRDKVSELLGVQPVLIDSALVSAQRRQRYYWCNFEVGQPADRGIMLRDVLDSAEPVAVAQMGRDAVQMMEANTTVQTDNMVAEPVGDSGGKSYCLTANYSHGPYAENTLSKGQRSMVAERVIIQTPRGYNKGGAKYDKSPPVTSSSWENNNHTAQRVGDSGGKSCAMAAERVGSFNGSQSGHIYNADGAKARTLQAGGGGCGDTSSAKTGLYAQRVGQIGEGQAERVYGTDGKSVGLKANGGGGGAKTGLYAVPERVCNVGKGRQGERIYNSDAKGTALTANMSGGKTDMYAVPDRLISSEAGAAENARVMAGREREHSGKIYTVKNGQITIKGKTYPIKLADGDYIIRKLSVGECRRLQTVPDWVEMPVSETQAYKMLGNGWTIEVIKHILSHIPGIMDEEVEVLSLYDGFSGGMIALRELGVRVKRYMAYEIDPYAIKVSKSNFPEIIQLGDASGVEWMTWM